LIIKDEITVIVFFAEVLRGLSCYRAHNEYRLGWKLFGRRFGKACSESQDNHKPQLFPALVEHDLDLAARTNLDEPPRACPEASLHGQLSRS